TTAGVRHSMWSWTSPKVRFVLMLPVPFTTVIAPSAMFHFAALPFTPIHSLRSFPLNKTTASDGAVPSVGGVTTGGTGVQTSVVFGSEGSCDHAFVMQNKTKMGSKSFLMATDFVARQKSSAMSRTFCFLSSSTCLSTT